MTAVPRLVARAAFDGRPALALTDHGNMAGAVELYSTCKLYDMQPWIGFEGYLCDPLAEDPMDGKTKRFHIGLLALDLTGYRAMIRLNNLAHSRPRFNRFPRFTMADLRGLAKEAADHVVLTTGCYFGLAQQAYVAGGIKSAMRVIQTYASMFPHTIVEIQNHNIDHGTIEGEQVTDLVIARDFVRIADRLGLPVMATQDSHYLMSQEKAAHDLMKRMVYSGADDAFPGDRFHLASSAWVEDHWPAKIWRRVEQTSKMLLGMHALKIPPLDKFKAYVPKMANHPDRELRSRCQTVLAKMNMTGRKYNQYSAQLQEELAVVRDVKMADYFLLVLKFVDWCRKRGICIEARGSANGSLMCYLLGITQVDPLRWGSLFERFLSRDRTKPPDVDIDIEDNRRGEALEWLRSHFETIQIGTWSELGSTANNPEKGSVLITYMSWLRGQCYEEALATGVNKTQAKTLGSQIFNQKYGHIKTIDDVHRVSKKDWYGLKQISDMHSVRRSYGVHAGGVLLAGVGLAIDDYVPKMLVASSDTQVTQFDMDSVESLGMLKLDLLGQKTLRIMRICQELIGRDNPCDFSWIPMDDSMACRILREGRTDNGIFHFEGYTKAKGGREMGIRSTKDAIVATALYMPGSTDNGQKDLYLRRRRGVRNRWDQPVYVHPAYERALKDTYGATVFQDQPLQILRDLGMSIASINVMIKVLKSSGKGAVAANQERMAKLRVEFDDVAMKAGIDEDDLDTAWHQVTGFIAYGMNRAHAAGYGIRSYRCAYLKAHHTIEFMTALLQAWGGDKEKEPVYVREARRLGLRLLTPDVNLSGASWTLDRKRQAIRRGLTSIKGIGDKTAAQLAYNAPYTSLVDLCTRTNVSGAKAYLNTEGQIITGVIKALVEEDALKSLAT